MKNQNIKHYTQDILYFYLHELEEQEGSTQGVNKCLCLGGEIISLLLLLLFLYLSKFYNEQVFLCHQIKLFWKALISMHKVSNQHPAMALTTLFIGQKTVSSMMLYLEINQRLCLLFLKQQDQWNSLYLVGAAVGGAVLES